MMFTDRHTLPILGAVIICTLPHFINVSFWALGACLCMWIYIAAATKNSWRIPGRLVMSLLAGIFYVISMTTHEGFTLEAFIALLALMVNLKLMEVKTGRDRIITVILCYFLIVSGLFFGDTVGTTLYMLFSILLTTAILVHVNQPGHGIASPLKLSAMLMVQAFPVALVMFLLFPRIQGGLWGRAPVHSAQTGFADSMSFGNISKLAQNSEVAFRVEFEGTPPPQDQLYWRGIVLSDFDGQTWRRGSRGRGAPSRMQQPDRRVDYTITLEPHNEHWLLTLDLPVRIQFRRAWLNSDHTLYRWWPITQRISYSGTSDLDGHAPRDEQSMNRALALPAQGNPAARAFAKSLADKAESTAEYVRQVLNYFQEQPYQYTLNPPPLTRSTVIDDGSSGNNLIDHFLFQSRKGFCEHFAGSFAFLMRAAGIPARVVVGYLGGAPNKYGGYMIVRQSDAHAWCEVWMSEKGWVRVDPTGVVAPARLMGDTASALPAGETAGLLTLMRYGVFGPWFSTSINAWDFLNSKWNKWVMDYSPYKDLDFYVRLGIDFNSRKSWGQALLITGAAAIGVFAVLAVMLLTRGHTHKNDETAEAWATFCGKLARMGIPRQPGQGPVDYLQYVTSQRPDLTDHVRNIISLYVKIRYSGNEKQEHISSLQAMIKRFSTRKPKTIS